MLNNRTIAIGTCLLLFAFMQVLWPVPLPLPTNQIFMMLGMLLILSKIGDEDRVICWRCLLFLGAIVLSIVCNWIPPFFKPWQRLMQFVFLVIAVSPLIESPDINRIRRHFTMGVMWACGLVSVLSFLAYLTGHGRYLAGIIQGYMGITGHPNFLGMFVMVAMVWFATLHFRSTENWERITWGGCWLASLIVILLSASRSSTVCALLGTLIVVYLRYWKNMSKLISALFILVLTFVASLPKLLPYMETMMMKGMGGDNETRDALVLATRGSIWELRLMELRESPWVGVGAYSCDIYLPNASVFYSENTGSIELGSSYLGLLSQMGWIGFLCFLVVVVPIAIKTVRYALRENTPYAQLMASLLVPIAVHMTVEGYAITAGAVQCVILWMVLGAANQCDRVADYPVIWEEEEPISPLEYQRIKEMEE